MRTGFKSEVGMVLVGHILNWEGDMSMKPILVQGQRNVCVCVPGTGARHTDPVGVLDALFSGRYTEQYSFVMLACVALQ